MPEPVEEQKRKIPGYVYALALLLGLFVLSLVIESCDTEKVEICDTTTGKCALESTCRPLLVEAVRGVF